MVYARPSMSRAIGLLLSGSNSSFTTATAIRSITPFPSIFLVWFSAGALSRLRQRQPVRYGGFVGNRSGGVVSLSPELFPSGMASVCDRPMKGTAARSRPSETPAVGKG